ncbi:MAG TPA: ribosome maturation factor RimM [Steroidobacteraceae bacterium]|nr:ribosome maturation factor RimM [Steroidobacteraceae bacterium]
MPGAIPGPLLTLGQVATAHGIRGWVLVRSFADPPDSLLDYDEWQLVAPHDKQGGAVRMVRLLEGAPYRNGLRVQLEGIEDRTAALALSGWWVRIARSALPPLRAGEHYRDDLVGFEVVNGSGTLLGRVGYFADLPVGPVMAVQGEREHLVPASPRHLLKIDTAGRRIEVDWQVE